MHPSIAGQLRVEGRGQHASLADRDRSAIRIARQYLRPGAEIAKLIEVLTAQNPAVKTSQPILMAQGTADTTVFPFFTAQLNDELLALGDDVDYQVFQGVTHGEIPGAAEATAMSFFERRLPAGR